MAFVIDATALLTPIYVMNSAGQIFFPDTGSGTDSTTQVLTWSQLIPASELPTIPPLGTLAIGAGYWIMAADAEYSDIGFAMEADGTCSLVPLEGWSAEIISGNNTAHLTVTGCPITIDARYLTLPYAVFFPNIPLFCGPQPHFRLVSKNMIPLKPWAIQIGSAENANIVFSVGLDGNFTYPPVLDIMHKNLLTQPPLSALSEGGPLRGAGTKKLEMLGIPVLIDARAVDAVDVLLQLISLTVAGPVLFANLLPAVDPYEIYINADVPVGSFIVSQSGAFSFNPASGYTLTLGEFHGLALITVGLSLHRVTVHLEA